MNGLVEVGPRLAPGGRLRCRIQSGLCRSWVAKHYSQIATPVLALAGERNYPYLRELLPTQASDVRVVKVNSSSHYVPEDQPEAVVRELLGFFKS
jgi:pimeloyl-ACP methyl ester carboxylesterase